MSNRAIWQRYLLGKPAAWVQLCREASKGPSSYKLAWFHREWADMLAANSDLMLIAPRGFMKSTIVNDYILGDVLFSPEADQHQGLLVCDNENRCRDASTEYRMILESDLMQELFGGVDYHAVGDDIYLTRIGARWHDGVLETNVRPRLSGPTIGNYTVKTSRTGMHIDHGWLHLDDAYVSQTARSVAQQEERRSLIQLGWLPLIGPHTKRVITGTRYTLIDEYGVLEEQGIPTNASSRSAEFPDGTLLWPERWDREALDRARAMFGETSYRLQFLNDPRALEGAVFRAELIAAAYAPVLPGNFSPMRVMGVDMAYGGDDYTAVAEVAKHGDRIYIVSGWQKRFTEYAEKYRVLREACQGRVAVTEANGPQRDAYETLKAQGVYTVPYPLGSNKSKADRARETLQPLLETGQLVICDDRVRKELLMFSGDESRHDDLVDAVVMACWYATTHLHSGMTTPMTTLSAVGHGVSAPSRRIGDRW
jgi:phage terminase large subunit-like protein